MIVGLVNFAVFIVVAIMIGGDAVAGHEENGRYFLSSHGKLTEVSKPVFVYSTWHTLSTWITHPMALLAVGLSYGWRPVRP
jgi:hypothetical protein